MRRALAGLLSGALLAGALLVGAARADAPNAPPMPKPEGAPVSAPAYGAAYPSCREWTDGCRVCVRSESGELNCSTPGIACQPQAIVCRREK